ncbi:MAG: lipoprotein insertase outer membrane protein LolB [Janthinobacterium lividum]
MTRMPFRNPTGHGVRPTDRRAARRPLTRALARTAAGATLVLAAAGALVLSGCATPQQKTVAATTRASTATSYQGRFAVRYADQTGEVRNAYGNFSWDEQADAVTLSLRNPLGSVLAIVVATPTSATLELPNQAPRTASNVEELMQTSLGFPMPVSGLRYWLRDQAAPRSHAKTATDASGRITQIVQDGWQIDYLAFGDGEAAGAATAGASAAQPVVRRMNLARKGLATDAPLEVKLVINP